MEEKTGTETVNFEDHIKPFFTECFRKHMLDAGYFDLWKCNEVRDSWRSINRSVKAGRMPRKGGPGEPCPGAPWDDAMRARFKRAFDDWKAGGYQPCPEED